MARYIFTADYESHFGKYHAGQAIELNDEDAAWVMRDSRGALEPLSGGPVAVKPPEVEPEARAIEEPPQDRMISKSKRRRR